MRKITDGQGHRAGHFLFFKLDVRRIVESSFFLPDGRDKEKKERKEKRKKERKKERKKK